VFNLQGSEIIFILLLALVVLGPEKLPGAIKRAMSTYAELRKLGSGFQDEFKSVIDQPMREMRETADLIKDQVDPQKIADDAERAAAAAAAADRDDAKLAAAASSAERDNGEDVTEVDAAIEHDIDPFEDPVDDIDEPLDMQQADDIELGRDEPVVAEALGDDDDEPLGDDDDEPLEESA